MVAPNFSSGESSIEKKDRVEDALNATRAAVEEGIVAGGGVALLRAQSSLTGLSLSDDQELGLQIIKKALEAPLRIIASNAGVDASVIVHAVRNESGEQGYDARTNNFVNMIEAGIIDPAKVTRSALQHAASISGLLLTTEAAVIEIPEEKKEAAPHAHGGGGGMPGMGMY